MLSKFIFFALLMLNGMGHIEMKETNMMEDYDPEKDQGLWFVIKRDTPILDAIHCIKYELHHSEEAGDIYKLHSWWINSDNTYTETLFNIVDDRNHKARYFFQSQTDKLALVVLGTDYDNWHVGFGRVGGNDTYYVSARTKTLSAEHMAMADEILAKNKVERNMLVIDHSNCPAEH